MDDVLDNFDPACWTRVGLRENLKKIYPGIKSNDWVTIVRFSVKGASIL